MKTTAIISICLCLVACQTKQHRGIETKPIAGIVKQATDSNTNAKARAKKIGSNTDTLATKLTATQLESKQLGELIEELKKTL